MDWIVRNIKHDELTFEPGCGCGANLIWLAQHGYTNLFGTDRSPEAIAAARRLFKLARISAVVDVAEGFLPPRHLKNIAALLALNCIYYAEINLAEYLANCRDGLSSSGHIILDMVDSAFNQIPNNQYKTDDWQLPAEQRRPTQYVVRMSCEQLEQSAISAGFTLVATRQATSVPPRYVAVLKKIP